MSTRFEATSSERAFRGSVNVGGGALSAALRFYLHSLPASGNYGALFNIYGAFVGVAVLIDSNGRLRFLDYNSGTPIRPETGSVLSLSTWYYLWYRQASGATPSIYLDGSTSAHLTCSTNIFFTASANMTIEFAASASGFVGNHYADVSLCGAKMWSADRAASNAIGTGSLNSNTDGESGAHTLRSTTSALGAWEFNGTTITDSHTTANNLTAAGTLSAGPDSPIDGGGGGPSDQPAGRRFGVVQGASFGRPVEIGRSGGFVMENGIYRKAA